MGTEEQSVLENWAGEAPTKELGGSFEGVRPEAGGGSWISGWRLGGGSRGGLG